MNKRILFVGIVVVLAGSTLVWIGRGVLRDEWEQSRRPSVPAAQPFSNVVQTTTTAPANVVVTSTKRVVKGKTTLPDPFVVNGPLPSSVNLAVPFLSQAPKQDWSMPYQEACEEASMIMVDAFERGRTLKYQPEEGDQAILSLVAFETDTLHLGQDLTAAQTAQTIEAYFKNRSGIVKADPTVEDIKRALANGYPVILPFYGKVLGNPNFHNGGPEYHMLVIKGYLADGRWITNDPGTRKGADYVYAQDVIMNAIHDWNGGDVPHGSRSMIVMLPQAR